jgi:hypothetical protein
MAINVAGTNALGDFLVSKIVNARILMGMEPQPGSPPPVWAPSSGAPPTFAAATPTELQAQVSAQKLANAQMLFGIASASSDDSAGSLPPIAGETPQQLSVVAIKSSIIEQEFSNIATLFGSLGLGTNTNTNA